MLGDGLLGLCSDYHAEPGLGLRCNVSVSALPCPVDNTALLHTLKTPSVESSNGQLLVELGHTCQVHTCCS